MSAILQQLELDSTFFAQLAIFAVLYFVLSQIYFRPFLRLFQHRHQKTVADRDAAERLMAQANAKLDEYKTRLGQERLAARQEYESALTEARKEETAILGHAREEAKKITQEATDSVSRQREQIKAQLEADIEGMARNISEKLLARKL